MAPNKVREVLNLIRDVDYIRASDILAHTDRAAAPVVAKLLHSCASNAEHNDGLDPSELYVATCYADEGTTLKRWRPRARGRATRIRKRTCHVTVIVSRMPEDQLARRRARQAAEAADRRARRVAGARRQGRAAARAQSAAETDALEPVDEQVLEIVAAGDADEGTDIDTAVEHALASDEDSGDDDAVGDDAVDEEDAEGDDAAGDEESD
jgi:large subunit ribosomal protein L22